ncbi:MAG: PriCT-2 domain-containing protein [Simplicispira suum]|uniref:DUF5906 domain-containing protein n=1 Tax=Simplicispira suum TaxID=2109915 RepID=UPI001C6C36BB|nr:DUF5906 domain-containing protein [Simplicispira suum]MBW7832112.1 PriCT-2 domain-containing protein [Simplicispira suum]
MSALRKTRAATKLTRIPSGIRQHMLAISVGNNCRDNHPIQRQLTIHALVQEWAKPDVARGKIPLDQYLELNLEDPQHKAIQRAEKDGAYFIPATFRDDGIRQARDVVSLCGFAGDLDNGTLTRADIEAKLHGIFFIAYSSYSHSASFPKWRFFVPYQAPITPSEHAKVYAHFQARFDNQLDTRCGTTAQLWYTPACPPDAAEHYQFFFGPGALLDVATIPEPAAKPLKTAAPKPRNITANEHVRVQSALATMPSDDREQWVKTGIALKQNLPQDIAWQLWEEWSRKSDKYDPDDCNRTWNSFKDSPDGDAITLGSIFFHAKSHGWAEDAPAMPKEVEELQATHFVAVEGAKTWVFKEDFDHELQRPALKRSSFEDFKKLHSHKKVQVTQGDQIKKQRIAQVWLDHPQRRTFDSIVFLPNQATPPGTYNTWRGFTCQPAQGDWSLMHAHIRDVICGGDTLAAEYLMNWMAFAVQHPEKPAEVAVVLQGNRGTGKGKFANAMTTLFGHHATTVTQASHLTGHFNGHLKDCAFLFVDEGMWAGDKAGENVLKALITEPVIQMEKKFQDPTPIKNRLHLMIASNSEWVVPAGAHERRYFVLRVSDAKMQDKQYFAALECQMYEGGGLEAMLHDLLRRDLSTFDIRSVPRTAALDQQVINSLDAMHTWWLDHLGSTVPDWQYQCRRTLVEACAHKCSTPIQRSMETKLGNFLKKVLPGGLKKVSHTPPGRTKAIECYEFPTQTLCRQAFLNLIGIQHDPWA